MRLSDIREAAGFLAVTVVGALVLVGALVMLFRWTVEYANRGCDTDPVLRHYAAEIAECRAKGGVPATEAMACPGMYRLRVCAFPK